MSFYIYVPSDDNPGGWVWNLFKDALVHGCEAVDTRTDQTSQLKIVRHPYLLIHECSILMIWVSGTLLVWNKLNYSSLSHFSCEKIPWSPPQKKSMWRFLCSLTRLIGLSYKTRKTVNSTKVCLPVELHLLKLSWIFNYPLCFILYYI